MLGKILDSTQYVVQKSQDVKINSAQVKKLAEQIKKRPVPSWDQKYHFQGNQEQTAQYLFLKNSLDFSLWPEPNKTVWSVSSGQKKITGYFALALALKKACEHYPLLDANFLSQLTLSQLKNILDPLGHLPLLTVRLKIIKENALILNEKYQGQAANIIKLGNGRTEEIVKRMTLDFPTFNDCAFYQGQTVWFLKHAQIFTADIWSGLAGKGLGEISGLEELTCFADNRLPQVLRHYKVLEYSSGLAKIIQQQKKIKAGSDLETEIRANTIWAVEFLRQELRKQGRSLPAFQIDWILWGLAHKIKLKEPPHLTRTVFY